MILFLWQDDIIGVARFLDACLERVYTSAGPPVGDQASDQPNVGWKRCNDSDFWLVSAVRDKLQWRLAAMVVHGHLSICS